MSSKVETILLETQQEINTTLQQHALNSNLDSFVEQMAGNIEILFETNVEDKKALVVVVCYWIGNQTV